MPISSLWQAPLDQSETSDELMLSIDQAREKRVLILPALFDEANKMRRLTVQIMQQLDQAGIDSFLPDLPGCNESLIPLETQTLAAWRKVVLAAIDHCNATHFLSIRAGALLAPDNAKGWVYASQNGPKLLRGMIRARLLASKEAGVEETSAQLMELGRESGISLAGWPIGSTMFGELESADIRRNERHIAIAQKDIGGAGLWLRAEPDQDDAQAQAIAGIISGAQEQAE